MPTQFVATTASICNNALRHLAISKPITTILDTTENALACNAFYDQTRDEVLREFNWPFARRVTSLGAVVGGTITIPVNLDWQYSYRLPADCLFARRLLPGTRLDVTETRIPFALGSDTTGRLLFTDLPYQAATSNFPEIPQLEYTAEISAEARFSSEFASAFSFKLAFYMAPALTGGDPNKLGPRAFQLYQMAIQNAQDTSFNERQPDQAPESSFIRTR